MENALLTICWIASVVLVVAIKDRFIDRPRMERLERRIDLYAKGVHRRFDRLITSYDLGVDVLANIAEWLNGNMEMIAQKLDVKLNGQRNKGKDGV